MAASSKHDSRHHADQTPVQHQALPASDELPSSYGDSPKRVTPKDVTPQHATWKDLKERDVGADRACADAWETPSAGARGSGSDTASGEELPSSYGDSPQEMTPKDVGPEHAAWSDESQRKISSADPVEREEALIDESSELSFPASDPPAELPSSGRSLKEAHCDDEEDELLDEAIELTFPASDPIAVTPHSKPRQAVRP
ncbi:MAG TPA: hypothetical protein VEC06_02240 [Paucimonas sp.]|nr:hypothetical protein [Paucimonas sp.]